MSAMHRARNVMLMAADEREYSGERERLRTHADNLRKAREAVAELVAADRELDEIRLLPAQPEPVADYQARLSAAWARRAAALARFGGGE